MKLQCVWSERLDLFPSKVKVRCGYRILMSYLVGSPGFFFRAASSFDGRFAASAACAARRAAQSPTRNLPGVGKCYGNGQSCGMAWLSMDVF